MRDALRVAAVVLVGGLLVSAQTLTFSPQPAYRKVALWSVSGCPGKPVSMAQIRAVAAARGIQWWTAASAADALKRRTLWGITLDVATGGAVVGAAATNLDWVAARQGWKTGFTVAAGALAIIVPIAKGHAPAVDSQADRDLSIDTAGCGTASFYAAPSNVGPFVAELK